uniref:Ig-like domain-containing protein n=1 Tax=Sphaeramia orbicularis TaxID=375764 RepID=A0A673C1X8_9TELE
MTNMSSICICILALTLCITVCRGDILLTQTPESISVQLGGSATIRCKASSAIDDDLAWYHQKPGQAPKFIIDFNSGMSSGRYQGSGYDYDLSLTISNIQAEDAGVYYCQQHYSSPLTFGGGTKLIIQTGVTVPPSISLFPPSSEQMAQGQPTLVCLLTDYSPEGATVSWEVDGNQVTEGVLTGEEEEKEGGKFVRISTLSLSKALWDKQDLYSCKVTHSGSTTSAELRRTQCSV